MYHVWKKWWDPRFHISFSRLPLDYFLSVSLPVWMNILAAILRFQGPPFTYRYGFSFLLYVSGFITTEVAGTYAIFLYISWHQKELVRRDSRRKNYGVGSISFFPYDFVSGSGRVELTFALIKVLVTATVVGLRLAECQRGPGKSTNGICTSA